MYLAAFTFPMPSLRDQRGFESLLHQTLTPRIPVRYWLEEREDSLRVVMEWPDRETALAWMDREDIRDARERIKTAGKYYLRGLSAAAPLPPLDLPAFVRQTGPGAPPDRQGPGPGQDEPPGTTRRKYLVHVSLVREVEAGSEEDAIAGAKRQLTEGLADRDQYDLSKWVDLHLTYSAVCADEAGNWGAGSG